MSRKSQGIDIIASMDAEIDEFLRHSIGIKQKRWSSFIFHQGTLYGRRVVMVKSGVGKVFAAMVCERMIDQYNPKAIVFSGVAGALDEKLEIGDAVISRDCIQHDLDVQALGFSRGTIPYTHYRVFTADDKLRMIASGIRLRGKKIMEGRILTGDQFMTERETKRRKYLTDDLKGDAIEMEGRAVATVCTLNRVPFLVVRTITDKANGTAPQDFNRFLPVVAKNSFKIVSSLLRKI
jgi:adenosylhomocysteine nucleosidase